MKRFKRPRLRSALFIRNLGLFLLSALLFATSGLFAFQGQKLRQALTDLAQTRTENAGLQKNLQEIQEQLSGFKSADIVIRANQLQVEINTLRGLFRSALSAFEKIQDLRGQKVNVEALEKQYARVVNLLAGGDDTAANDEYKKLLTDIDAEATKLVAVVPAPATESNTPPGSGYNRQSVKTDSGTFTVSLIAADLNSTRVIVDTASDSDCVDNCPVLPLATYVARSGAYAGVNGTYFCPATYPSCAGKTNSFDLLVMNKNKHYFNSDNNVYSTNPAAIFSGNSARFVNRALEWGRDAGVDAVISNFPLLVLNDNIVFSGSTDPSMTGKGGRSFVANKGSAVFIGTVSGVTMAESAAVMKALGMENAMNLDDGGSVALWSGGYKIGPGRDIPNAVLFVKK